METARTRRLPEEERMIDCWARARNVFWQQMVGDEEHPFTMLNWQVYSVADGSLVDVIEMRDQDEIVGRTHLYYDEENASIRELFVRPTRRREYIGSILEGTAAEWARNLGAKTLSIWLGEADARERLLPAPEAFAVSHGYEWEDVEMRRPNVVKIARRNL
jgi:GNAT superfamily N-acetyltransferase